MKPLDSNNREMVNKPIKFVRSFNESPFNKYNHNVRTNTKMNLISVDFEKLEPSEIKELTSVKKIGDWDVSCFIAGSISRKIGVISPVSPSEDLQDIKELALVKEGHGKIVHIERLKKRSGNNSWEDSTSLKCIFEADKLPIAITIAHSYYRVRPYVEEPRRCYNCQRFGHMAGSCRSSTKCRICGENHKQELCNKPPKLSKCANCGGGHVANSRDCEIYNTAWVLGD